MIEWFYCRNCGISWNRKKGSRQNTCDLCKYVLNIKTKEKPLEEWL